MEHKGLRFEVVTLIGKSPDASIKLLIISRAVEFGVDQLLTKIDQGSFSLGEGCLDANSTSITFNSKKELKIRWS